MVGQWFREDPSKTASQSPGFLSRRGAPQSEPESSRTRRVMYAGTLAFLKEHADASFLSST